MFDITVQVPGSDPRLRAGFTTQVVVVGDVQKNVLYVPRQALFMDNGKRVVYVKNGNGFEAREVKVEAETESRAAVSGLTDGSEVALVNPAAPRKAAGSSSSGSIGGGVK
jgi:predicted RNase H-like nuclease (RuvC/YqgF family)